MRRSWTGRNSLSCPDKPLRTLSPKLSQMVGLLTSQSGLGESHECNAGLNTQTVNRPIRRPLVLCFHGGGFRCDLHFCVCAIHCLPYPSAWTNGPSSHDSRAPFT